MIATTIEQSKHLELGLDSKTADMVWRYVTSGCYRIEVLHKELFEATNEKDIPAWSLSALLEVIPPYIKSHYLKIEKTRITDAWYIDYQYLTDSEPRKDLLTAAYEMVCWLLENNLIKKGGEE